jgi:hypothetical protein
MRQEFNMKEFEVTCVSRNAAFSDRHECITHIGNSIHGWRLTKVEAIARIEAKTEAYYTVDRNTQKKAYIGVVKQSGKPPYLRTYADGVWNDNLVSLLECVGVKVVA